MCKELRSQQLGLRKPDAMAEVLWLRLQNVIEYLSYRSLGFQYGIAVVHGSGEIGVGKRDPAEGRTAQDFSWCRSTIPAKEEARLRAQIGMTPAVQNDSRDIPLRVKPRGRKHLRKLFTDSSFIVPKRSAQQLRAAAIALCLGGFAGIGIEDLQRKYDRRVRTDRRVPNAREGQLAHIHIVADTFKPAASAHSHFVQKTP